MSFPRFKLVPGHIDVDVPGWELTGDRASGERIVECHELFHPHDDNADIEAALTWADRIIGTRQVWTHARERGFDRWEAGARDDESPAKPTPAEVHALAAEADALQSRIQDIYARLWSWTDEEARRLAHPLADASANVRQARDTLGQTATALTRD
ncbi:hypothetical protein NC239_36415 [Streptomyces sp. G3]|uniref:hypothetical protein n=1 Tax=Streptomyces sp. G3 TaxID=690144 RepID=UPI0020306B02|nr:hypothetical protein [Streptomyces sp. G3]MCM1943676.1 hypothetical protein [Streptomyces sp. G3]